MAYHVRVMPRAKRDLAGLYAAIDAENSDVAFSWFRGLEEALLSLERLPLRCPRTPEDRELRHLLYGKKPHVFQVIFRVIDTRRDVEILHIRHGARDRLKPDEIRGA